MLILVGMLAIFLLSQIQKQWHDICPSSGPSILFLMWPNLCDHGNNVLGLITANWQENGCEKTLLLKYFISSICVVTRFRISMHCITKATNMTCGRTEGPLNINMSCYQCMGSHYKERTVSWLSYRYNGNTNTWKGRFYIETGPRLLGLTQI